MLLLLRHLQVNSNVGIRTLKFDLVHNKVFEPLHFFLCNQDSLFLYREGSFIADPQIAHFELLTAEYIY